MKIAKGKTTAVSLFLLFAIAVSLVALPTANAHDPPWQIPTFAFVQAVIDPVGVGQTTYIYMWIDKTFGSDCALTNDWRFHNYKLTITKPDGETETKTWDVVWDTTSSQGFSYTPDQVGTYTLKFEFPGQDYNAYSHNPASDYVNDTFLPSSAETTLTVQEELIEYYTVTPLPTEYWTRPIYGENTDWWSISSDWLGSGSPMLSTAKNRVYVADGVGPSTSHVMWTKPLQSGGVVGGDNFEIQGDTYFEGSAYINRFVNPIILDGKLYYTEPISFGSAAGGPTVCVDLRTGEVIWSRTDVSKPSFGYIEAIHNPQQHGVSPPMLVATSGTTWEVYDAYTGDQLFTFNNVPSGATAMGSQGEYMQYVMENAGNSTHPDYRLLQWNSSRLMFQYTGFMGLTPLWTGTFDASVSSSYDWNISIPWRNTMTSTPTVIAAWYNDIMLCYNGSLPSSGFMGFFGGPIIQEPYTYFAVNLNASKGAVGSVLWMRTYNPPVENITIKEAGADPVLGVFVEKCKETNQWVGYSLRTGEKLWGPVGDQLALDYYGNPGHESVFSLIAYGNVYVSGYSGIIYCYDGLTGELLWSYGNGGEGNSTHSGFEVPGHYPTSINAIANGIIYTVTTEHTVQTPIYKGATARAINATDGTEIWTISGYTGEFNEMNYAVADGYATWFNGYDNQIYSVGRGPSATTVMASPKVSVNGDSVLVEGTVIDTAAGTAQDEQAARFPNGVPAVSDESMSDWMEYVYMQQPRPTDVTGVEVVLTVLDPNNNYYEVGRTTSDADGFYSVAFTPEVPGKYTIIATFEGSEGYWPSHAETAINVEEVPAATPAPTPTPAPMTDTYVLGIGSAILIAVIIGFVLLLLRKR
jgi:outer membrane protein assembly factor BamB